MSTLQKKILLYVAETEKHSQNWKFRPNFRDGSRKHTKSECDSAYLSLQRLEKRGLIGRNNSFSICGLEIPSNTSAVWLTGNGHETVQQIQEEHGMENPYWENLLDV